MLALVTGGTNGIGADIAATLAARGDQVIVTGRDQDRGRRFVDALPGSGHRFAEFDVADEAGWRETLERDVGDRPLDILILNAGSGSSVAGADDPAELLDRANFAQMVGVNLDGVVTGLRTALPSLSAAGTSKVVVISSIAGLVPIARDPVYSAVKTAAVALVRSIAPALAERGITITAICPGSTLTGMMPEHFVERRADGTLISKRTGSPIQQPARVTELVLELLESSTPGDVWVVDARTPVRAVEPPQLWPGKFTV